MRSDRRRQSNCFAHRTPIPDNGLAIGVRRLYNIFFTLWYWGFCPTCYRRIRRHRHSHSIYPQYLGRLDRKLKQALTNRHVLWIYAGEGDEPAVCTQLIRALEARLPNLKLVVSVTTAEGMKEVAGPAPSHL